MNFAALTGHDDVFLPTERRVLIVDDDRDFAEGMAAFLDLSGCTSRVANNVEDALKQVRDFEPVVALLDIRLDPATSGLDLIPVLKKERPDLICIMVTAFAEVDTAIDAVKKGAYDYLRKPLNFDEMNKVLDRCFETVQLAEEKRIAEEERDQLSAAIEQTGEGIFITDFDGVIQYANPALERITGFKQLETIGKKPNIFKSGKTRSSYLPSIPPCLFYPEFF